MAANQPPSNCMRWEALRLPAVLSAPHSSWRPYQRASSGAGGIYVPPSGSHDRVLLEITPDKDSGLPHPCFKSDGQRFAEADTTLKLVREGRYTLSFVCSPPATITLAEISVGM